MITPNDVKFQLMATLPRYTSEFGSSVVGAAVVDAGAIKVTAVAHGLTTGDIIVGSSILLTVPVISSSFDSVDNLMTLTTGFEHDRTSGLIDKGGYNKAVLQDFADVNYNGSDFTIVSATRTTVVIEADADVVGSLGNMIEERSLLFGFLEVTVTDVDTFTVPLDDTLISDAAVFDTFDFVTKQRIFIAADPVRATDEFAQRKDPDPALYIIFLDENASKDRDTISDAVLAASAQNPLRVTYIPEVMLMSLASTKTQHSAAIKQQQIYEELKPALRQAMFGHYFDSADVSIMFAAVEVQNGPIRHNTNNYVHGFTYQIPYQITFEQGDTVRQNVSFRDLVIESTMFNTEGALVSSESEPEI